MALTLTIRCSGSLYGGVSELDLCELCATSSGFYWDLFEIFQALSLASNNGPNGVGGGEDLLECRSPSPHGEGALP